MLQSAVQKLSSSLIFLRSCLSSSLPPHDAINTLGEHDDRFSIKRINTTRWSCRADAVKALISDFEELKEVL